MSLIDSPVAVPVSRLFPLQDMSAGEIAARIAARDIPAAEIVEHFIARLKAVNTRLNAVTVELFDSARKTAAKFDDALLRGEKLAPLAGLPVTIKECFDLAGTASTFGLPSRRAVMESEDDPYVAALRAAGAIPIAKTNVPQLLIYTESDNPIYGRTNNPWNMERSCGGNSSAKRR
jgi:fatty acid amide hydrolase